MSYLIIYYSSICIYWSVSMDFPLCVSIVLMLMNKEAIYRQSWLQFMFYLPTLLPIYSKQEVLFTYLYIVYSVQ